MSKKMLYKWLIQSSTALFLVICSLMYTSSAQANAFETYKTRFIQADGAVVDTGNQNISHSEGQGYALMFALAYDDKETFEKVLGWTNTHLKNPDTNLFFWSYRPNDQDPIADKNNASDGDLFIAWTLIKASKIWNNKNYALQAEKIIQGIYKNVVHKFGNLQILIPGLEGFYNNSYLTFNPSYLILPALKEVVDYTHLSTWTQLYKDSNELLTKVSQMQNEVNIAPDWVDYDTLGNLTPAQSWPARSSFDAIRVPLYMYWSDPQDTRLSNWRDYFGKFEADKNPAWVNITTGETAKYSMTSGQVAVRALVLGDNNIVEPVIEDDDDYYNASLKLLVYLAKVHF